MDSEDRQAHAERVLGDQANQFFSSDLGQFIIAKSANEVKAAMEALRGVDPEDPVAIRLLQENIAVAELGLRWINEAINIGQQRFAQDEIEKED